MATAKRIAAVAPGFILGLTIMLPATVIVLREVQQQYRHHQFLSAFFHHCAKGVPMVIEGVPYICMVGRLNRDDGEVEGNKGASNDQPGKV